MDFFLPINHVPAGLVKEKDMIETKKRTIVIGDVHGNIKGLKSLFENASITKEDKLIFLGDYVDGLRYSFETIEELIRISKENECVFLMGNHDEWHIDYLRDYPYMPQMQMLNGGRHTFNSYKNNESKYSKEEWIEKIKKHLLFFQSLKKCYYLKDNNYVFVHAGLVHGHMDDSKNIFLWDRELMSHTIKTGKVYEQLKKYDKIFIGHTGTGFFDSEIPIIKDRLICMDTDGGWYGRISCMDIETFEFWQSEKNTNLYSENELGR